MVIHACIYSGCERTFSKLCRLRDHVCTHTGERYFVCPINGCGKSYTRSAHLKRHEQESHTPSHSQAIVCSACSETFSSTACLKKHFTRKHIFQYSCTVEDCGERFPNQQQLKKHISTHTGGNKCQKEGCGRVFGQRSHLIRHMKTHLGYPCTKPECGEVFEDFLHLRTHVAKEHTSSHLCMQCGKEFKYSFQLNQHEKTHGVPDEVFNCPHAGCSRTYNQKRNLGAHIRAKHGGKKFQCPTEGCLEEFCHSNSLKYHMKKHDPETSEKTYRCSLCSKSFARSDTLYQHIITHTGKNPYQCIICSTAFTTKKNLNKHMTRQHHTSKTTTNTDSDSLGLHVSHLPAAIYEQAIVIDQCLTSSECNSKAVHIADSETDKEIVKPNDGCSRTYNQNPNLGAHIRSKHDGKKFKGSDVPAHTEVLSFDEDKTYQCSLCNKTFARRKYLHQHMKIHTGEKPYLCAICSTAFTHYKSLSRHMTKQHHTSKTSMDTESASKTMHIVDSVTGKELLLVSPTGHSNNMTNSLSTSIGSCDSDNEADSRKSQINKVIDECDKISTGQAQNQNRKSTEDRFYITDIDIPIAYSGAPANEPILQADNEPG